MDAITKIFSSYPDLNKSVIDLVLIMQSNSFTLNNYFN